MTKRLLAGHHIEKFDRDLRILIATNGTLTRVLAVVCDEEIVVQIVDQEIHSRASAQWGQFPGGRILQRRVLLQGRDSGRQLIAAESLVAADLLPPGISTDLLETNCPIGEIMAASRLETFKEAAEVWVAELPDWLPFASHQTPPPRHVGRQYRVNIGGRPAVVITEYFLEFPQSCEFDE